MNTTIISMIVFAFIGAASPGPVNIIATGSAANYGFIKTIPHVLGASVSYCLIVLIAGLGVNELLQRLPEITDYIRNAGAIFLLYMSYKIATSRQKPESSGATQNPPGLVSGALVQCLNPKAWLVSISGISLFVAGNSPESLYLAIFSVISLVICFLGVGLWAALGHIISKFLSDDRYQATFNSLMGLLLASTVIPFYLGF